MGVIFLLLVNAAVPFFETQRSCTVNQNKRVNSILVGACFEWIIGSLQNVLTEATKGCGVNMGGLRS